MGKPVSATTEVTVPKLNKSFSEPALDKHMADKHGMGDKFAYMHRMSVRGRL